MEPSKEGARTLAEKLVQLRSMGLIGACIAGGLVLSVMVIGSAPSIPGLVASATDALPAEAFVDPSSSVVVGSSTIPLAAPTSEVIVDLGAAEPVTPPTAAAPRAALAPVTSPRATFPAAPLPGVAATLPPPRASTPSATVAPAPATTVAPTTALPTTTTAAVPPSTAAVTFPAYALSGVANLSLQFDGSSISVASLTPQANWVYEIAKNGPRNVEVKFFNVATGRDREFHATVEGGRVRVES